MYRHRHLRRLTAWLLAALVVFAQTAAIAYACAIGTAQSEAVASAPCPMHIGDEAQPAPGQTRNLCEVHCLTPAVADVDATVAAVVAIVAIHPTKSLVHAPTRSRAQPPEARGKPPPVHLRSTRLLI